MRKRYYYLGVLNFESEKRKREHLKCKRHVEREEVNKFWKRERKDDRKLEVKGKSNATVAEQGKMRSKEHYNL